MRRGPAGRALAGLAALLGAGLTAGCLVQVDHCRNADAAFREARAEAERAASRSGRAHSVHVLVFDPDDEKLVRIDVPLWLAKKACRIAEGDEAAELDLDLDDDSDLARQLRRRVRLAELERAGPGLLVEVEEAEGEQVLVWLR